jgi:hypothetical protein
MAEDNGLPDNVNNILAAKQKNKGVGGTWLEKGGSILGEMTTLPVQIGGAILSGVGFPGAGKTADDYSREVRAFRNKAWGINDDVTPLIDKVLGHASPTKPAVQPAAQPTVNPTDVVSAKPPEAPETDSLIPKGWTDKIGGVQSPYSSLKEENPAVFRYGVKDKTGKIIKFTTDLDEVKNLKGGQTAVLQGMGVGAKKQKSDIDKAIDLIKADPASRSDRDPNGLSNAAKEMIVKLEEHRGTKELAKQTLQGRLAYEKGLLEERKQEGEWRHEDKVAAEKLKDAENIFKTHSIYDFNPDTQKNELNEELTLANMAEKKNVPDIYKPDVASFMKTFEDYYQRGLTKNKLEDNKTNRNDAWDAFKKRYQKHKAVAP